VSEVERAKFLLCARNLQ